MSIDPSTLVLMIINFVVLMLLLNIFLFKPVLNFMQQRQQRIDAGKNAGEKATELVQQKKDEISAMKAAARKDSAQRIAAAARESDEAVKQSVKQQAKLIEKRRQDEAAKLYAEEEQLVKAVEQDIDSFVGMLQDRLVSSTQNNKNTVDNIDKVGSEYTQIVRQAMIKSGICKEGGVEQA